MTSTLKLHLFFLCQCDTRRIALGYPSVSAYGSVGLQGFEYHSGFSESQLMDVALTWAPVFDSYSFIP